jgi:predicted Fe-Mo cluster-binding NifX family protein
MMKMGGEKIICLACYGERLAAIIDNASHFLLFKLEDNEIYPAGSISLPSRDLPGKISLIKSCGVDILICGGISGCTIYMLQEMGILVIPWVAGTVEQVLSALKDKTLDKLAMPGCKIGPGCPFRKRRRGRFGKN